MSELTFAEAALLHLDRAMRELSEIHRALQVADEHMTQAEQLSLENRLPPTIKVINENVQSIGISLVNTNDGLALKVQNRGSTFDHMVGPGKVIELRLDGS